MRILSLFLAFFFLYAPAVSFADVEQAAKEGFKGVPEGMKKIARAIEGSEEVDKKAKQHWKAMDKLAKKTWKKASEDIKKKTRD